MGLYRTVAQNGCTERLYTERLHRTVRCKPYPGVAMRMSHPRSISRNWFAAGAPPYTTTDETPVWYENLRDSSW